MNIGSEDIKTISLTFLFCSNAVCLCHLLTRVFVFSAINIKIQHFQLCSVLADLSNKGIPIHDRQQLGIKVLRRGIGMVLGRKIENANNPSPAFLLESLEQIQMMTKVLLALKFCFFIYSSFYTIIHLLLFNDGARISLFPKADGMGRQGEGEHLLSSLTAQLLFLLRVQEQLIFFFF